MIGERLAVARKQRGFTQWDLAVAMGERYTQSMISAVERGRSSLLLDGAMNAARELGVSLDWLVGLSDDPSPPAEEASYQIVSAIGEQPTGPGYTVPTTVRESGIEVEQTRAFTVSGDSMHPTLPAGSIILVDGDRTDMRDNRIYLYRATGVLYVGRALDWPRSGWWWKSDNPDSARVKYEPSHEVLGEVRWVGQQTAS